jgi:hypothetical protein
MIKEFWIDKNGGRYYHTKDCPIIKEIPPRYEPIKRHVSKTWQTPFNIAVEGKKYLPCSCVIMDSKSSRREQSLL